MRHRVAFSYNCFLPARCRRKRWVGRSHVAFYSLLLQQKQQWFSRYLCYRPKTLVALALSMNSFSLTSPSPLFLLYFCILFFSFSSTFSSSSFLVTIFFSSFPFSSSISVLIFSYFSFKFSYFFLIFHNLFPSSYLPQFSSFSHYSHLIYLT